VEEFEDFAVRAFEEGSDFQRLSGRDRWMPNSTALLVVRHKHSVKDDCVEGL
jgi:hypothetical protein